MLTEREYAKALLLDLAWFEAHHLGGFHAMQMVAQCVANRVRSGFGDWCQVISEIYVPGRYYLQSSHLIDRLLARRHPDTGDPTFKRMLVLVDQIYNNTAPDLVKGAYYWGDLSLAVESYWDKIFLAEIVGNKKDFQRTAQLANFCVWGPPISS